MRNGIDRALKEAENCWTCQVGDTVEYTLAEAAEIHEIKIVFDSDLTRDHLNMVSNYTLAGETYAPPATLVTAFHIEADGEEIFRTEENHQRFVVIPWGKKAKQIKLVIDALGENTETAKIFRFDFN